MNTNETRGNSGNLTGAAAQVASDLTSAATHQVGDAVNRGKAKLSEMQSLLTEKTKECAKSTDTYVHDNPWQAIGIAAGIGLIVGLLIRRS